MKTVKQGGSQVDQGCQTLFHSVTMVTIKGLFFALSTSSDVQFPASSWTMMVFLDVLTFRSCWSEPSCSHSSARAGLKIYFLKENRLVLCFVFFFLWLRLACLAPYLVSNNFFVRLCYQNDIFLFLNYFFYI